jgi:hypothetical protein
VTTTVRGKDLKVGDHIRFLCQYYEVIRFEPYPNGGPTIDGKLHPARVAVMQGKNEHESPMTVLDEDDVEILDRQPFAGHLDFANFLDGLINTGPVS